MLKQKINFFGLENVCVTVMYRKIRFIKVSKNMSEILIGMKAPSV